MNDIEPDSDYSDDEEEDGAGVGGEASLSFEQYDVILPKARLESFKIAIMSERGPFTDDIPQFIECSFHEKEMLGKGIRIYLAPVASYSSLSVCRVPGLCTPPH